MKFSDNQIEIIDSELGTNLLIKGYAGVGKTTVLLKKYDDLVKNQSISRNKVVYIVSDELKKQITLQKYFLLSNNYNMLNIYTINELIYKYLDQIELPLFSNTIKKEDKKQILNSILSNYKQNNPSFTFTLEYILEEINFIQNSICIKDHNDLQHTLNKELKKYLMIPRKSMKVGLLTFKEKYAIWDLYKEYLEQALSNDFFDKETFYQSFLRLIYHHHDNNELALSFSYIFVDDIQDFSMIQLDIIYCLFDNIEGNSYYLTLDELKSYDRYHMYKKSLLYRNVKQEKKLDINFRNSENVFNIMTSLLKQNELFTFNLPYRTHTNIKYYKSVLTYFYNKKEDEKQDVFFDRLNLLVNNLGYSYKDILVVFSDYSNLENMTEKCEMQGINIVDIYEHVENRELDALTFVYKSDLTTCEYKVVIIYDADDKKLCIGPINKIININTNYIDTIYFYLALSCAKDFLIINSSFSEPSHLLLPAMIDCNEFVFDVGSQFEIKSTLNIYRISEFIAYIKDNLCKYYGYNPNDFKSHQVFDIFIDDNIKIGIKILDNNIDNDTINYIHQNSHDLAYIVIFDSHHYLTFKNVNQAFIRVNDIPSK